MGRRTGCCSWRPRLIERSIEKFYILRASVAIDECASTPIAASLLGLCKRQLDRRQKQGKRTESEPCWRPQIFASRATRRKLGRGSALSGFALPETSRPQSATYS